jgi:hypothetical protein
VSHAHQPAPGTYRLTYRATYRLTYRPENAAPTTYWLLPSAPLTGRRQARRGTATNGLAGTMMTVASDVPQRAMARFRCKVPVAQPSLGADQRAAYAG